MLAGWSRNSSAAASQTTSSVAQWCYICSIGHFFSLLPCYCIDTILQFHDIPKMRHILFNIYGVFNKQNRVLFWSEVFDGFHACVFLVMMSSSAYCSKFMIIVFRIPCSVSHNVVGSDDFNLIYIVWIIWCIICMSPRLWKFQNWYRILLFACACWLCTELLWWSSVFPLVLILNLSLLWWGLSSGIANIFDQDFWTWSWILYGG